MTRNTKYLCMQTITKLNEMTLKLKSFPAIILILFSFEIYSQAVSVGVNLTSEEDSCLSYPWAGGMNSCQFGEIDLDMDGVMDLLVFDRTGNRLMPFLNEGIADSASYLYAPEYIPGFPELYDWVILRDYNGDGKQDIFTFSKGFAGILVYKNISKAGGLEFERMVYPFLTSFQGSIYTNILVTYADYPAIIDLDGDGDLDILTFWGLGSFVELHQNMSMEKYGVPDSLDYKKVEFCWGNFAESDESNHIYLDTCIGGKNQVVKNERHTGSTFLVNDMNGDGVKDLVLGDVDYPNLVLLMNAGTSFEAYMESQNWNFPEGTNRVYLFSMPAAAYLDLDNDQVKDMIVSPFDPSPFASENHSSNWLYKNHGASNNPSFALENKRFLQENMIDLGSGAYPVLFDYNGDGLADLIVGNYGYYDSSWYDDWYTLYSGYTGKLALFENVGTEEQPEFLRLDYDYLGLSSLQTRGLVPTFGDLDGDQDMDLILGGEEGRLYYYENIGGPDQAADFVLVSDHYMEIDVGDFSAPFLFDLDQDNLTDLIIGERKGNLNYYKNTGTVSNPQFELITDSLGKVNVTDYNFSNNGFSVPQFFTHNEKTKLLVGSEQGKIFYFENIDGNLAGAFTESDSLPFLIDSVNFQIQKGYRTAATIADLNMDARLDLIVGNFAGGMNYYSIEPPEVNPLIMENEYTDLVEIFPNPATNSFIIRIETKYSYAGARLYDAFGRVQGAYVLNPGENRINSHHLPAGLYVVKINFLLNDYKTAVISRKILINQ